MPQEATGSRPSAARAQAESQPHRMQDVLALASVTVGLAALVLGWIPETHFFGAVLGTIGLPLALYSQMVSATTNERWLNVIGMIAAFIGAGFALSNGGFSL
ncbi:MULTISPECIES: hypothetical protein [Actinomadura]|uniref:SPW repeat-containing protein n=1 Tax=Actinomadura madurae TaxID=1993 RepID=A0A1I5YI01_9ACTN|nr:hypothetical protein [Actinomadura madurae]MCP9952226.1 hypothetical protein [Actinomadura madurae]MCP9968990.1 hypothetical protein [Actinomadura madurae]MCP9981459.1 hypothetical protein [Actinomadura madurae]MCQ0007026.1 hypothetical protein [Actinomadura madurae]MCQ0017665.1 hypothetical protein [Actinomadura madurae]